MELQVVDTIQKSSRRSHRSRSNNPRKRTKDPDPKNKTDLSKYDDLRDEVLNNKSRAKSLMQEITMLNEFNNKDKFVGSLNSCLKTSSFSR